MTRASWSKLLLHLLPVVSASQFQQPFLDPLQDSWETLLTETEGRVFAGSPFASSCFAGALNTTTCVLIQKNYDDEVTRANAPGGYINTQWETCQSTGAQCLLDFRDPKSEGPINSQTCQLGSVPDHFIQVEKPSDISAGFKYSKSTGTPLTVKNTGHDYKGRSSAPGSLGLWTHKLKKMSYELEFTPEGCDASYSAVTVGAGVQWGEIYAFAEEHNVTVVGGSDKTVGVVGGWLQGGGHGALSPSMGMGVDRVLEFKVVTPDGVDRIANACQNQDLFWALRGGGGGTFGVVHEATILASPPVTLQVAIVRWKNKDAQLKERAWTVLAANAERWADEGWGGFSMANVIIYINPLLSKEAAAESMKPLFKLGKELQSENVEEVLILSRQMDSWYKFFSFFAESNVASVGSSLALASRLINRSNFATPTSQEELVTALVDADNHAPGLIILISPPAAYATEEGTTSITPLWRESIFHVTVISKWNWDATKEEKRSNYTRASEAADYLRKITPVGAYSNEADVYEPEHEESFWGSNYDRLLSIKQKYDPDHLLDCWHCVGWNPESSRFSCYL